MLFLAFMGVSKKIEMKFALIIFAKDLQNLIARIIIYRIHRPRI